MDNRRSRGYHKILLLSRIKHAFKVLLLKVLFIDNWKETKWHYYAANKYHGEKKLLLEVGVGKLYEAV
jgi:hypothetical protein